MILAWRRNIDAAPSFALEASTTQKGVTPKKTLHSLVSKHVRRDLLSGDIVYSTSKGEVGYEAVVRVFALEDGEKELVFKGMGNTTKEAGQAAAAIALAELPKPPEFSPKYAKPEVAGASLGQQLAAGEKDIVIDYVMKGLPDLLANIPSELNAVARFILDDEAPCKVLISRASKIERPLNMTRVVKVSSTTMIGKLAQSLRCRLLDEGDDGGYKHLELQFVGQTAGKIAATAIKLLQRHLPPEVSERLSFTARQKEYETMRRRHSLVAYVDVA